MSAPLSNFLEHELFTAVCGKELGSGAARKVYEHRFDPTLVIKFEGDAGSFQNVTEWQTWLAVEHTEHAKWFAPCVAISANGAVLVQRRTSRPTSYPDKLPVFLTDTKFDNYGAIDGVFVCHDYGTNLLSTTGMTKRMRKADWWNLL